MIGKVKITSSGYDPDGPRVHDPTLEPSHDSGLPPELRFPNGKAGPLPATGPWIKIEPGCKVADGWYLVFAKRPVIGEKIGHDWWDSDSRLLRPTHYAIVRLPEAE